MAAPKLTDEQQAQILSWLAADYSTELILSWCADKQWPVITPQALSYYRNIMVEQLETLRTERFTKALASGLALRAERVQRLKEHADKLELLKWVADPKTGRYWNEAAWRATLADIAAELGERRQGIDLAVTRELERVLDLLKTRDQDLYARLIAFLNREDPDEGGPVPSRTGR